MMKKLLMLLIFCGLMNNSYSQTANLKTQIDEISASLIKKCNTPGTTKVAILGFYPKSAGSVNTKFCGYVSENIATSIEGKKYTVIEPGFIEDIAKEFNWDYSKRNDHELLGKIAYAVYQKHDIIVGAFLWGDIEDLGDEIKINTQIVKSEIYTSMGVNSTKLIANEESDNLLNKPITHITQKPEPITNQNTSTSEPKYVENTAPEASANSTSTTSNTQTVQYRGGADPLKGLNIAEEKKALQVGTYYALVIGIDNYSGTWAKLSNAVNDAKALEKLLKTKYKFDAFRTLYNEQATRENIINEFEWLINTVKDNDNVLIYYSGHGEYKKELNKGYWVPIDANTASTSRYISNNDIQTYLSGIKSKHTLLISDACFSGDIFRGKTITIPFEESDRYYSKVYNLVSRKAITSGGIEPVMDGGRDGHSVFAYYLLKNLNSNNNSFYDASQLFDAIKIPVVNNSQQSPNFQPIKDTGDEGGQFIFIKK